MKRLLITGCNGLLGSSLVKELSHSYEVLGADRGENPLRQDLNYVKLDITKRGSVRSVFMDFKPYFVINAAAFTDVDACEVERERAWQINVGGVQNVLWASEEIDCRVVHISTDFVFDGENGPYPENAEPNPINYYGETKLAGEKVWNAHHNRLIVRTSVLYGYHPGGTSNFATWVIQNLTMGKSIRVVTDQFNTPTYVGDLVDGIEALFKRGVGGIFHIAGPDFLSRYDFAVQVAEVFDLNKDLISPITSEELERRAKRPKLGGLRIEKARKKLSFHPLRLKESLARLRDQMGNSA